MAADSYYDHPPREYTAQSVPTPENQVANAATYMMHQSYHIRRALERIADALEGRNKG